MKTKGYEKVILTVILCALVVVFLTPVFFILMNSF